MSNKLEKKELSLNTSETDFDKLADKYYAILDKIIDILKKEDMSIDESIALLDAITTSIVDLKRRSYEDIREVF